MKEEQKEALKAFLPEYVRQITTKRKGSFYNCPLCGSGTGKNKTPAFSIAADGQHWKCFSCGEGGDLFDLIGKHEHLSFTVDRFARAQELFGDMEKDFSSFLPVAEEPLHVSANKMQKEEIPAYLSASENTLHSTAGAPGLQYLLGRGFSLETITTAHLGYDEKKQTIVIPYGGNKDYFITRSIHRKTYWKPPVEIVGSEPLFGGEFLTGERPVFVVEGQLDALSICEVGGVSVAIGGSGYYRLIQFCKSHFPVPPLLIALDQDERGKLITEKLCAALDQIGVFYLLVAITGQEKDANDALQRDREVFAHAVQAAEEQVRHMVTKKLQVEKESYIQQTSAAAHLQEFVRGIQSRVNTQVYPTGFVTFDQELDGGLYEGLYVIGAISSLGKTTLILQIADHLAANGQDVLIVSLEMAREELMAKSISRQTFHVCEQEGLDRRNAKTTRGITTYSRWAHYRPEEVRVIQQAFDQFGTYAQHLFILEGTGNTAAADVHKAVANHVRFTGKAPVVIVDYLQLLAPGNSRLTDKQAVDRAVLELKQISRDYKIPVITISSLNRISYTGPITMAAFKESGAIEYSSDVLIGLQLKGADTEEAIDQAKRKDPREIELKILKNRNGRTGGKVEFFYYPLFNYFEEISIAEASLEHSKKGRQRR